MLAPTIIIKTLLDNAPFSSQFPRTVMLERSLHIVSSTPLLEQLKLIEYLERSTNPAEARRQLQQYFYRLQMAIQQMQLSDEVVFVIN